MTQNSAAQTEIPEFRIEFHPNPVQKAFIESRATADLFCSRMGEGKSAGLAWSAWYLTRMNPGARGILVRDTWENLRESTQKEFFKWFPPGVMGDYKESTKTFTWTCDGMRGEVGFIGMDDPNDATKAMSRELCYFGIDEPAPAQGNAGVDELIFNMCLTRLRQPNMNFYGAKLAENNPDESHWTYRRFVLDGRKDFRYFQPQLAENEKNLPAGYYQLQRLNLKDRPDLQRRFVDGKFGFQQIGRAVTPEWSDDLHLATGLIPIRGELVLLWDFGLNPTCVITQPTPMGNWNVLEAFVGAGIGVQELIEAVVKPRLAQRYMNFTWRHIGDPAGISPEQSSSQNSAVLVIRRQLGGRWTSGPSHLANRIDPLRAVLRQTRNGLGLVRVDREHAKAVWYALRGGWHRHVSREGIVSADPIKNEHSHPGDCMGYGAAKLFPLSRLVETSKIQLPHQPQGFSQGTGLGFERPGLRLPPEMKELRK